MSTLTKEDVKAFKSTFEKGTTGGDHVRTKDGVNFELYAGENELHLEKIASPAGGLGAEKSFLENIVSEAREAGIPITCRPIAPLSVDQDKLIGVFKDVGFDVMSVSENKKVTIMQYNPNTMSL